MQNAIQKVQHRTGPFSKELTVDKRHRETTAGGGGEGGGWGNGTKIQRGNVQSDYFLFSQLRQICKLLPFLDKRDLVRVKYFGHIQPGLL